MYRVTWQVLIAIRLEFKKSFLFLTLCTYKPLQLEEKILMLKSSYILWTLSHNMKDIITQYKLTCRPSESLSISK